MVKDFQIKGLEKMINSSAIMNIYPMVDHIKARYNSDLYSDRGWGGIEFDIFLNDPTITKENMYDKEFDPHYLVEYHIRQYFPYFDIDKKRLDFIVWGPDGDIVTSYEH